MNIAIIGSYAGTNVGGAELSTLELVKSKYPAAKTVFIRPSLPSKYLNSFVSHSEVSTSDLIVYEYPPFLTRILNLLSFSTFSYPCIVFLYFLLFTP